jgi:D-3-phosphoglycerate dehydrogenase
MSAARQGNAVSILISDPVDEQCQEIFRSEGYAVDYRTGLAGDALKAALAEADVLIVRSQTQVTAELLEGAKRLKVVGRAGAGVDNIDVEAATRQGVLVMNTPGGNTISTAEHTISLMLALARNIPQANRSLQEGKWDRKSFVGTELYQKTLGVAGLGKVGAEVAKRCLAFGMDVIGYDPVLSPEVASKMGVRLVGLEELFSRSDILTVHSPLTPDTKDLVDARSLALCKDGVRVINCARGGIVNETALLEALNSGKVAGAALDVFETEPPLGSPLVAHPKVVCTPHLGASTEEAQEKVAIQVAHQVVEYLNGKGVAGAVNAGPIAMAMKKDVRPYLGLATRMGTLLAEVQEGAVRTVEVTARGPLVGESLSVLGAAVLQGIFAKNLSDPVNLLNAALVAKERGIRLLLHVGDADQRHANVLAVSYQTERGAYACAGTVFAENDARIVEVDGFHCEMRPEGNLLFYRNLDRPGMLASVAAILAGAKINIGGLSLGRLGDAGNALTVISTDSPVSAPVLREIAAVEGVSKVRAVRL